MCTTNHTARAAVLWLCCCCFLGAAVGRPLSSASSTNVKQWPEIKPTDKCTPFDPSDYEHPGMDTFCDKLQSMSDDELRAMHGAAPLPNTQDGFPLRGCTHRCIVGHSYVAHVARMATNNLGWAGKCFSFEIDQNTGTPTRLINLFGMQYDNTSLPDSERVPAKKACEAKVSWQPTSYGDGKPAWVFDHSISDDVYDPVRKMMLVVKAFRDEMRQVRPGFLLGRIFLQNEDGNGASELPIFFALFQACTADGQYPTTPEARAMPHLGGK